MHDGKFVKAEINLCKNKTNTNFYDNKIPEENECYACFSVLLLDFVVKTDKGYYPQILLEERENEAKKKNIINPINGVFDDSDKSDEG